MKEIYKKINSSINELKTKIDTLNKTLLSLSLPQNGNFAKIVQIKSQQSFLREEIERLKQQIIILENRKKELLNELKNANIEYEKMKYLQAEEIKKILKGKKLKEAREMDEIAIMLNGKIK